ncbi:MAG TPA: helix-turn-helix transcriptional regulator [Rhizomicrobium sp.]|jgi:DNA-binding NarL/FixJ family response regulator
MSAAARMIAERPRLRVAIVSNDPLRRAALAGILAAAGYSLVAIIGDADVVLADGPAERARHAAVIRLSDFDSGDVQGALPEDATALQIEAAIEAVAAGLMVRARSTTDFDVAPEPKPEFLLTPRELEVLAALVEGLSNKAIARKLDISQHTVKFHAESLYRKLGVRSRSQAVIKGLTTMSRSRIDV